MTAPRQLLLWLRSTRQKQAAAAKILGIHKSTLSQFLNGEKTPSLKLAVRLQHITGIRPESWVPTSEPKREPPKKIRQKAPDLPDENSTPSS